MLEQLVFYGLSVVILASALGVVLLRHVLHSALLLGLCLAGVAGLFASLGADFLFASQILIYVGGIAVLILFVVLLSGRASDFVLKQVNEQWMAALLVSGIIFGGLYHIFGSTQRSPAQDNLAPTTFSLGKLLLGDFSIPFELISVILLASLLGAVLFSRGDS
ncbi:MAG: NADH-quinone oxidoreductase subunit J [Elusimicrobia bacterium]|nr:NADH-quinone oxidoreductase subunit J [Elusimicrobiota bacterium]